MKCPGVVKKILTRTSLYCKLDCMKDQAILDTPGRRAAAYWFADGLPEIVVGLGFATLGGVALWFHHFAARTWKVRTLVLLIQMCLLGAVFVYDRAITLFLKSRLTFPRTGYVRPPAHLEDINRRETVISLGLANQDGPPPDQNVTHFRTTTIGVLIAGNFLAGAIPAPADLPIALCAVAVLLYFLHRRSERPYHWAALLPLAGAGFAAMTLHMSSDDNSWATLLLGGVWLAAMGACTLAEYLRTHPRYAPAEGVRS